MRNKRIGKRTMKMQNSPTISNYIKKIYNFNKLRNIYDNTTPTHKKYYGVGFFH